jgi:hypothetical protein
VISAAPPTRLPIRGVFVQNAADVTLIVQLVAERHLDWAKARSELRDALEAVQPFELRDPIESAESHLRAVSDEAHFYVGLAFGITLANLAGAPMRSR